MTFGVPSGRTEGVNIPDKGSASPEYAEMINKKESFKFIHQYITVFNLEGISNQHKESIALEEDIRLLKECHHTSFFIRLKKRKKIFKTLLLFIEFLSRF
jgi:hypothetical protein